MVPHAGGLGSRGLGQSWCFTPPSGPRHMEGTLRAQGAHFSFRGCSLGCRVGSSFFRFLPQSAPWQLNTCGRMPGLLPWEELALRAGSQAPLNWGAEVWL